MKSFYDANRLLNEQLPPPPPPTPGALPGPGGLPKPGGLGGLGGGLPPLPPPGGGLGGGLGGLGGGLGPGPGADPSAEPVKVKAISANDVWDILEKSLDSMSQHEELSLDYLYKKKQKQNPKVRKIMPKSDSLIS